VRQNIHAGSLSRNCQQRVTVVTDFASNLSLTASASIHELFQGRYSAPRARDEPAAGRGGPARRGAAEEFRIK
jgi:hypothetical protein